MCRSSIKFFSGRIYNGYQQTCAIFAVHGAAGEDERMKNGKEYRKEGLLHAMSYVAALNMLNLYGVNKWST